ncbi:MAG: hypothetical protein E6R04_08035 [Spirochaetes bacterium]|nr:MAG: hypothetical protein E6R04_08035 [Spirochaetota bacterium]
MTTGSKNWQTWCTACSDYVATDHTGACAWCGGAVTKRLSQEHVDRRGPSRMTAEQLDAAIAAYQHGHSIDSIARALWPRTRYKNEATLVRCLRAQLRRRGVRVRSSREQTKITFGRRAELMRSGWEHPRQCAATTTSGRRCRKLAVVDGDRCATHTEERAHHDLTSARSAHWESGGRRRFSEYADALDAWRRQHGTRGWLYAAQRVGGPPRGTLVQLRGKLARGQDTWLSDDTEAAIRRMLGASPEAARANMAER